jgi:hypothetical protein
MVFSFLLDGKARHFDPDFKGPIKDRYVCILHFRFEVDDA